MFDVIFNFLVTAKFYFAYHMHACGQIHHWITTESPLNQCATDLSYRENLIIQNTKFQTHIAYRMLDSKYKLSWKYVIKYYHRTFLPSLVTSIWFWFRFSLNVVNIIEYWIWIANAEIVHVLLGPQFWITCVHGTYSYWNWNV